MPNPIHPGVYIEEVSGGLRQIRQTETAVTAFIGEAIQGPVGTAEPVKNVSEYKAIYGEIASGNDTMGLAVQAFFQNGGQSAYICRLAGNGSKPSDLNDFTVFFETVLSRVHDVGTIVLPGIYWEKDGVQNTIISAALDHCRKMGNRITIFDLPEHLELDRDQTIQDLALPASPWAVLYYPWVNVLYPQGSHEPGDDQFTSIAPSAFAAGIWARFDENRGVWSPPAGTEALLFGAESQKYVVTNVDNDRFQPRGINSITTLHGSGPVLWGARTLGHPGSGDWHFLWVRRLALMIKQSIYEGIQWAVFEANGPELWALLRKHIDAFMKQLYKDQAFRGDTTSKSYFINCDRNHTMTQEDIDQGWLILVVGFAPIRSGEFNIITIRQKMAEQQ